MITQQSGLQPGDTKVNLINDLDNFRGMQVELTKYLTSEDIVGFSWSGRKEESDYDQYFTMMSQLQIITKQSPFLLVGKYDDLVTDQNSLNAVETLKETPLRNQQGELVKYLRYQFDNTQRMKVYTRYPANTVAQGLSRVGGLLAILNIVGIAALFIHQYLFERRLRKLDMQFLSDQQEQLEKQREELEAMRQSIGQSNRTKSQFASSEKPR